MFTATIKTAYYQSLGPFVQLLVKRKVTPALLTVIGFFFSGVSALFFSAGSFRWAGVFMLFGGLCDSLDGQVARAGHTATGFGAFFDSTVDRFAEILVLIGLLLFYLNHDQPLNVIVITVVMAGSLMVSYIRARAEGVGQTCTVGLLPRPGRVVLMALGALGGVPTTTIALWIIAILSVITVLQRFYHVGKKLRSA